MLTFYIFIVGRDAKLNTLNLTKTRFLTREALKGQFGQALLVEKLLKLDKSKKGEPIANIII